MPLVDLVSRSSVLVTIPTEDYFILIVLIPVVGAIFVETSTHVPTQEAALD